MVLLAHSGALESGRVVRALHATFGRQATHSLQMFSLHLRRNGLPHLPVWRRGQSEIRRFRGIQDSYGILCGALKLTMWPLGFRLSPCHKEGR
jgi:hypothetical protein